MSLEQTPKVRARVLVFKTRGNNKTVKYVLTPEDYLTLARAVEFEGAPKTAVAWTLLQRFAFLYPTYKSLHTFIVAYAQPLNPRWFPSGDLHKEWIAKLTKAGLTKDVADEKTRASRRVVKAVTTLERISVSTHDTLNKIFLSGATSPVPGSVHYRAPTVITQDKKIAEAARAEFAAKKQMLDTVRIGDPTHHNWFFAVTGSHAMRVSAELSELGKIVLVLACIGNLLNLGYQVLHA